MAVNRLFPVFDVPEIPDRQTAKEQKYRPSVFFDYETGDFRRDGANKMVAADGKEAYTQWCQKVVLTERFTRLAYGPDIGAELEDALNQADSAAVESAVERTVNEALMVNPRTEYVRNFEFFWNADSLRCEFTVKGRKWEEQRMTITLRR